MERVRILSAALVLFLVALPLVSSAASSGNTPVLIVGGVMLVAGGILTLAVHFIHGDTCEDKLNTEE
jgi:hypothetical protein